ncbi:hypothetical protein [Streptomyces sp. CA-111067]|uniref:hypothetical protein n=1 Tax=Streptomyces sp. CA-111067 TaxID=3240046 RepID=UPI003D9522BA
MADAAHSPVPPGAVPVPGVTHPPTCAGIAALIDSPGTSALVLDVEGILVTYRAGRPALHDGFPPVLARLADRLGQVLLITRRPVTDLFRGHAGLAPLSDRLYVLGSCGTQAWDPATGRVHTPVGPAPMAWLRAELPFLLEKLRLSAWVEVEDRGPMVALHPLPEGDAAEIAERLRTPLTRLAARHHVHCEVSAERIELGRSCVHLGTSLPAFLIAHDAGPVLYATAGAVDTRAAAALGGLRQAGVPVTMLHTADTPCLTPVDEEAFQGCHADTALADPDAVLAVLAQFADALEGSSPRRRPPGRDRAADPAPWGDAVGRRRRPGL